MLTAAIETIRTATLIILTLTSGEQREFTTFDDELCWLTHVVLQNDALWWEGHDLKRHKAVDVECKCVEVGR